MEPVDPKPIDDPEPPVDPTPDPELTPEPEPPTDPKPKPDNKKPGKVYTQDELDAIVKKRLDAAEKKAAKEKSEAEKFAKMNEDEKADYETRKKLERLEELERKEAFNEMKAAARKVLKDREIDIDDGLLDMLVDADDHEKTMAAVDAYETKYKADVEKAMQEALKRKTPTVGGTPSKAKSIGVKAAERINQRYKKE